MSTHTAPFGRDFDCCAPAPAPVDFYVVAEDAPIGVQLWPTRTPEYAPNFTLASVAVVRSEAPTYVVWTYESGTVRTLALGEQVACRKVAL